MRAVCRHSRNGDDFSEPEGIFVLDHLIFMLGRCHLLLLLFCGFNIQLNFVQGVVELPGRCTQPQRAASLDRFRQKRKERCYDKKVRYSVRQEVALRYYVVSVIS